MSQIIKETKYLLFIQDGRPTGKRTDIVEVLNKGSEVRLGVIKWYYPWRQYALWAEGAIFNPECLDDICAVIREMMEKNKAEREASKTADP